MKDTEISEQTEAHLPGGERGVDGEARARHEDVLPRVRHRGDRDVQRAAAANQR